ncbi:PPR superfamily protein [Actinidia rufa]|uniref:PPR superfamily protein n=1 Tax=Actinidia rufa TaxID=165716 RepID=A0A7J0G4X9_9ERIC|nr:PPR superfamily protein [Actinidia rufa]
MHRVGVRPNQFTYGSTLRACTSMMCLGTGEQIQGCVEKTRLVKDLFVQSALVDMYSKCGNMEDACCVFESMAERDVVSWNVMISGYAVQGLEDDAFQLFRSMLREGMIPDCFTLGSVMKASCRGRSVMKVIQVHVFIIHLGYELDSVLTGSLIDAYVKCGSLRIAYQIYKTRLKRDTISCTALITGYAREGIYSRDAFDLFNEIHQTHMGIDNVILCSMLNMCANTVSLDLGRQFHALALKYQPNHDVALGNALIDMMKIKPNASLWGAILGACCIYSDKSLGEVAARHLFDLEPEKSVNYVVLANIYAAMGLWESVSVTRKLMEERSLRKCTGYSLFQPTNKRLTLLLPS